MRYTIAIVEDDANARALYAAELRRHDYRVDEYASRDEAMRAFDAHLPDLAILDVMLGPHPEGGYEICEHIRRHAPRLPVLFVTANQELSQLYGFKLGAWDYHLKPVNLDLLVAKIEALFRLLEPEPPPVPGNGDTLRRGELELVRDSLRVHWRGQPLLLTPTEFDILYAIAAGAPNGVSYDQLAQVTRLQDVENNTINTHVLHIRKKFRRIDPGFEHICTRYGYGYYWDDR